jgi:hypothetical protein
MATVRVSTLSSELNIMGWSLPLRRFASPPSVTASDSTPPPSRETARSPLSLAPSLRAVLDGWPVSLLGTPWVRPVLLLGGGLVVSEGLTHWLPVGGGSLLTLGTLATGWWWLSRDRPGRPSRLPSTLDGWQQRCEQLIDQFERLQGPEAVLLDPRRQELQALMAERRRPELRLTLTGTRPPQSSAQSLAAAALRSPLPLRLDWGLPLPLVSAAWEWPETFAQADVLLYHLRLPLLAVDLRWLEALPADQPHWLLVECQNPKEAEPLLQELASQWPTLQGQRLLLWDGGLTTLQEALGPLAGWLNREGRSLRQATPLRSIQGLHTRWQADLERLRRQEFRRLLQRTQGVVATGVAITPVPSLDLLVLAVANGLMLKEMARLWDCPWTLDQLRGASLELAKATVALGLVEWSSQALMTAARLHGATWLVGGALQALSAAYLTRVVGHAMADLLALSAGVSAPDLALIQREAPLLVARAAEAERLDWSKFLQEARGWIQGGGKGVWAPSA